MAFRMRAYRTESLSLPFTYYYAYLSDNTPTLSYVSDPNGLPTHVNRNDIYDDPVFLSTSKTSAKRWQVFSPAFGVYDQPLPIEYGRVEYILMTSPNGTVYAYGLNDNGTWYLEAFTSGVPTNREVVMTLVHKGKLIFVGDNRRPMPRPGDEP